MKHFDVVVLDGASHAVDLGEAFETLYRELSARSRVNINVPTERLTL